MSANEPSYRDRKQRPPVLQLPTIYGIYDQQRDAWYMVNGLVFHTLYQVVAEAQLDAMLGMAAASLPASAEPRYVVLPLERRPVKDAVPAA